LFAAELDRLERRKIWRRKEGIECGEAVERAEHPDDGLEARVSAALGVQDGIGIEAGLVAQLGDAAILLQSIGTKPPAKLLADLRI
jgi:hypothetical protein